MFCFEWNLNQAGANQADAAQNVRFVRTWCAAPAITEMAVATEAFSYAHFGTGFWLRRLQLFPVHLYEVAEDFAHQVGF